MGRNRSETPKKYKCGSADCRPDCVGSDPSSTTYVSEGKYK